MTIQFEKVNMRSPYVRALLDKLDVFKAELSLRALDFLEQCALHEAEMITDEQLALWIARRFPVTLCKCYLKSLDKLK